MVNKMLWVGLLWLVLMSGWPSNVWACSLLEPPAQASHMLWVHLEGLCFSADQREWAVSGADILAALESGKSLDLQGALIVDDVMLDQLPLQPLAEIPLLPPHLQAAAQRGGVENARVISGSITIRDSQFEKVLATNLVNEVLVILGDVHISSTTFMQSVDFSKIIFVKPFVFSHVKVEHEGFFIGAQFEDKVDFSHTYFGTHARFHKAKFQGPVSFAEAEFKGVAEFLEVTFEQEANFSQANFLSGTGFSGSVYQGPVDFSGVRIKQEIYFRFAEFRNRVSFRGGQFRSVVDFSNSRFEGEYDFSEGEFAIQPQFTDSNISVEVPLSGQSKINQTGQWVLLGGLALLIGLYLWISKNPSPTRIG